MAKCRICKNETDEKIKDSFKYYVCEHCGRYVIPDSSVYALNGMRDKNYDIKKLKVFLYYHRNDESLKYIGDRESYLNYIKGENLGRVKCVDIDTVEDWFPKTFSEKIDMILLKIHDLSTFNGDIVQINYKDEASLYMCDKRDVTDEWYFTSRFLHNNNYVAGEIGKLQLQPEGLDRIDKLQRDKSDLKQVFIAMSFDESLDKANIAIQKAIKNNHYEPLRMDEYKHNNQIVPEMLFQIKRSKFVVVDLTNHNNGAYYEAGYAQALGKQVILTCKKESFQSDSHFDVKQQATIIWEDENDLEKKLTTWIEATIV